MSVFASPIVQQAIFEAITELTALGVRNLKGEISEEEALKSLAKDFNVNADLTKQQQDAFKAKHGSASD